MNSEVMYQRKILVFFDVLGFKEIVSKKFKDEPEKIEEILTTMHLISHSSYPSELIVFSDSVINVLESKPPQNEEEQSFSDYLSVILSDISSIQINMMNLYGVLIRGSIVLGDIRYNSGKNILFGPALIHAYELESKHSIYPRFLIDTEIIDSVKENINSMDISCDVDGHHYVDSFKWLVKLEAEKKHLAPIKKKVETTINNIKKEGGSKNLGVLSKYYWFLNKIIEREQLNL